jgi:cytochrome c biogenesis protein
MAGLGRSESAKVPEELGDLAGILYDETPAAPGPDDPADSPDTDQEPGTETPVPAEGAEQ